MRIDDGEAEVVRDRKDCEDCSGEEERSEGANARSSTRKGARNLGWSIVESIRIPPVEKTRGIPCAGFPTEFALMLDGTFSRCSELRALALSRDGHRDIWLHADNVDRFRGFS